MCTAIFQADKVRFFFVTKLSDTTGMIRYEKMARSTFQSAKGKDVGQVSQHQIQVPGIAPVVGTCWNIQVIFNIQDAPDRYPGVMCGLSPC